MQASTSNLYLQQIYFSILYIIFVILISMAKIITIAQQKGGAGKTTVAACLAISLMQTGKRVVIFDIDPQGSLTFWYNIREQKYGKGYTGITFITSTGWRLPTVISQYKDKYDYILIDSPPHTETESKAAIRIADIVVVPMQPSPTDLWATKATLTFSKNEQKLVKILLNRYNPASKVAKELVAKLSDVFTSHIGNRVAFVSCLIHGMGVTEYDPASSAALEIKNLTEEVLSLLEPKVQCELNTQEA